MSKVAIKALGGCLKTIWYLFALIGGGIAGTIANVYVYNIATLNGHSGSDIWFVYPVVSLIFLVLSLVKPCYFNGVMVSILATLSFADPDSDFSTSNDEATREWFAVLPAIMIVIALIMGSAILIKSTVTHTVSGLISSGLLFTCIFITTGVLTKLKVADIKQND